MCKLSPLESTASPVEVGTRTGPDAEPRTAHFTAKTYGACHVSLPTARDPLPTLSQISSPIQRLEIDPKLFLVREVYRWPLDAGGRQIAVFFVFFGRKKAAYRRLCSAICSRPPLRRPALALLLLLPIWYIEAPPIARESKSPCRGDVLSCLPWIFLLVVGLP
ncbi:hypothetical protein OPV22_007353 [Ensete ventricosum]|uniref:Uncharacterized protein n=1 Tax=Ensete ventricosum TaxID=4639 RepID=A0AAV8QE84_ENSVE|nr:hypothetical protein OPV22_007353 [Ensete ventricosum]